AGRTGRDHHADAAVLRVARAVAGPAGHERLPDLRRERPEAAAADPYASGLRVRPGGDPPLRGVSARRAPRGRHVPRLAPGLPAQAGRARRAHRRAADGAGECRGAAGAGRAGPGGAGRLHGGSGRSGAGVRTGRGAAVSGVPEVTDEDFAREVLGAELHVLVEFTADWCPPCRQMAPVLGALAAEEEGRLKVVQLNVDANPGT